MLEIIIKPTRQVYYNEVTDYGVFGCNIAKENHDSDKVKYNRYGNITVLGSMPLLKENCTYVAKVQPVKTEKHGLGYKVISIYENLPTNKEQQMAFLKALLTERQIETLFKAYPNDDILELIEHDKVDINLLSGIGEVTFDKIKQKIANNKHLQFVFQELHEDYSLTRNLITKLCEHYKSPQILLEKIRVNPYILADEIKGIGFKKADEIAMRKGMEKSSSFRLFACLKYILNEEAKQGHTYCTEKILLNEMCSLLYLPAKTIQTFLNEIKEEDYEDIEINGEFFALSYYKEAESNIAFDVKRLMEHSIVEDIIDVDNKIAEVEMKQGFEFTDEQKKAIYYAMKYNVVLVNGKAGTGKTSVIKGIVNILLSSRTGYTYNCVALSGKASQRIKESTGLESSTIHRFLETEQNLYQFVYNRENQRNIDLVIVDEASMINAILFSNILEALQNGTKVIITGDYSQLEPIGAGNVFFDLCQSKKLARVELTKVHRQAQKSGILSVANEIREGISSFKPSDYSKRNLGELEDLHLYPFREKENQEILKSVIKISEAYKKSGLDLGRFQVITPLKSRGILCTKELNKHLQNVFNPHSKKRITKGSVEFRLNDKVIQNGNNYSVGILNGTIGYIKDIDEDNSIVTIHFENVNINDEANYEPFIKVEYKRNDFNQFDLAYALTVHRTQGSQFENCVFVLDYSAYTMLSRQLVYTALTRSVKHCYLVCELRALIQAIRTDKSSKRRTFLSNFLTLS